MQSEILRLEEVKKRECERNRNGGPKSNTIAFSTTKKRERERGLQGNYIRRRTNLLFKNDVQIKGPGDDI
jgi:hypothetical protein